MYKNYSNLHSKYILETFQLYKNSKSKNQTKFKQPLSFPPFSLTL